MRKSETGASVRVIELPGDRLAEAAGVLAAATRTTRTPSTSSRTRRFAPWRFRTYAPRDYVTPRLQARLRWDARWRSRRVCRLVASGRVPAHAGATAPGRARRGPHPGHSPAVDPPPVAVHGQRKQAVRCTALLVSGGGRRRSQRGEGGR
jgi:hypothetical protein